jgi:cytidine deaminase
VFYKGNNLLKKANILSYGVNRMGDTEGLKPGIHAEHDALLKLIPNKKRKLKNINLLVIRVSGKNKLQSSKPCNNCIQMMKKLSIKKRYKIQNVYYSDNNENIIKTTLYALDNEEKHYSRYYKFRKTESSLNRKNSFIK